VTIPSAARVLLPQGATLAWPSRSEDNEAVMALPPGAPVALADRRVGSRARLRRDAVRLGVAIDAEYVVLPTWNRAMFVANDDPSSVLWLMSTLATTPPDIRRGRLTIHVALASWRLLAAAGRPGAGLAARLLTLVTPARLVIGRRR
jgi:hypothetical protein